MADEDAQALIDRLAEILAEKYGREAKQSVIKAGPALTVEGFRVQRQITCDGETFWWRTGIQVAETGTPVLEIAHIVNESLRPAPGWSMDQ